MIYFDNAATTAVSPAVRDAMLPYFTEIFGNPSSIFYSIGSDARRSMEEARKTVADCLGCDAKEIYFTASGSEADNWAIKGAALKSGKKHIITSAIEHHAVIHTCEFLEKQGVSTVTCSVFLFGEDHADFFAVHYSDDCSRSIVYPNQRTAHRIYDSAKWRDTAGSWMAFWRMEDSASVLYPAAANAGIDTSVGKQAGGNAKGVGSFPYTAAKRPERPLE